MRYEDMRPLVRLRNFFRHSQASLTNKRTQAHALLGQYTAKVNPTPILIFGNQKSGTSAITALLGEAIGASYTMDIFRRYPESIIKVHQNEWTFDEFLTCARYYFSKEIIKDPGFVFYYDELYQRFPRAKRVFILRDPRQNIRSILNRLKLPGDLPDLPVETRQDLRQRLPNWYRVLDGTFLGYNGTTYIETLALRCNFVFQTYLRHQHEVIPIKYEDFVNNKVEAIHHLAEQLDRPVENDIRPLKDKQFQPKGNHAVSINEFFGQQNVARIEQICAEEMEAFGYT